MTLDELALNRFLYRGVQTNQTSPYNFLNAPQSTDVSGGGATSDQSQGVLSGTNIAGSTVKTIEGPNRVELDAIRNALLFYVDNEEVGSFDVNFQGPGIPFGTFETSMRVFFNNFIEYMGRLQYPQAGAGGVDFTGTANPDFFPAGWSVAPISTGVYEISFDPTFPVTEQYGVFITPFEVNTVAWTTNTYTTTSFRVEFTDLTNNPVDCTFYFLVIKGFI